MPSGEYNSGAEQSKVKTFADDMLTTLNHGALCLMISIGHRCELFDIMSKMAPATSVEIASRAGLNERYVREWLGAMVMGRIVEVTPGALHFFLPPEHAAFLIRDASIDNLAVFSQYIPMLGAVEDDMVECFRKGGGVPYSKYTRFHEIMAEESGQSVLLLLETHILPLIPGLRERLSNGIRMLDVGCGQGHIINKLASLYPRSLFFGIDFSNETLAHAREEASLLGCKNIQFIASDLSDFDTTVENDSYDFITSFDAIHDQSKPLNVLKGINRALKADGVYLMQENSGTSDLEKDVEHHIGTLLYTISCLHCLPVSLAQDGEGLGAMWGEENIRQYLHKAGFLTVIKHHLAHDIQNYWYVVSK